MTKISQKQLIESLKQLKTIKPRKEWVVLIKSQICPVVNAEHSTTGVLAGERANIMDILSAVFAPRKLAYAFAVVLFLIVGVFGITKLLPTEKLPQQPAALTSQNEMVIKNQISATVRNLAQNLKDNPVQDPQTIKALARTLANMPGDIASSQDVKDLYQTIVESQISDLQKTTLTEEQKNALTVAEDLYNQGKYIDALEEILLINK